MPFLGNLIDGGGTVKVFIENSEDEQESIAGKREQGSYKDGVMVIAILGTGIVFSFAALAADHAGDLDEILLGRAIACPNNISLVIAGFSAIPDLLPTALARMAVGIIVVKLILNVFQLIEIRVGQNRWNIKCSLHWSFLSLP